MSKTERTTRYPYGSTTKAIRRHNTTLRCNSNLHIHLKKVAEKNGMPLHDLVENILTKETNYNEKNQKDTAPKIRKRGAPVELDFAATKKTKKSAVSFSSEVVTMLAVAGLIAIIVGVLLTGEFILTVYQN